ncbi:MAG: hypothetical protein A2V70_10475 [Planctomycetes bacterium RBG_13_63_9]|nr:MAG: hypothetical protein A2V70_10475 [Planctomycetes bacterium RBG_13_63_9]
MRTYRVQATLSDDGTLTLQEIPFRAGERVEVVLRRREPQQAADARYPLHGKPIQYVDPLQSVAEDEWEAPR